MKTLNRIYLLLAVIMTVVITVQLVRWHRIYGLEFNDRKLMIFAPAFAFSLSYILTKKCRKKSRHIGAICLSVLALGFWGLLTLVIGAEGEMFGPIIDIARYNAVVDDYWSFNKDLVSQFPRPIPADAKNVHFYFRPHFLTGGSCVQLRCTLPPDEISGLYDRFAKISTRSFYGGNIIENNETESGQYTTDFYTGDTPDLIFPKDYEIMAFDPPVKKDPEDSKDNVSHGVAISKRRNEIVYWAEAW